MMGIGVVVLVLLCVAGAAAQTPHIAQPDQAVQIQSLVNKIQAHLNICLQDAAREEALRIKVQQELATVRQQLEDQKKALGDPPAKKGSE